MFWMLLQNRSTTAQAPKHDICLTSKSELYSHFSKMKISDTLIHSIITSTALCPWFGEWYAKITMNNTSAMVTEVVGLLRWWDLTVRGCDILNIASNIQVSKLHTLEWIQMVLCAFHGNFHNRELKQQCKGCGQWSVWVPQLQLRSVIYNWQLHYYVRTSKNV